MNNQNRRKRATFQGYINASTTYLMSFFIDNQRQIVISQRLIKHASKLEYF